MQAMNWMALGAMVLGLTAASGVAEERIAVVKLEVLFKAHPETAAAEGILEKQRASDDAERRDMLAQRDRLRSAFEIAREEAENPALSEEAKLDKVKALEARLKTAQEYELEIREVQAKRQKEFSDQSRRLRERIFASIQGVVAVYAREQGYAMVLNAEDAGMALMGSVLYHDEKLDITEALRERIGKETVTP